jgi:pimeloyl-ACP methyl ester carboxylesterase
MAAGDFDETFALDNLLGHGWAVMVTDYPGMGTDASPGDTPYAIGIPEGFAVLDAARAALRVPGAGLSPAAKVGIEGYSQGGGAAGWAAQLAPTYTPDVNLVGVAMGGTPANLQATAKNLEGSLFFGFLAGTAIGLQAAYPELNIPQYETPAGVAAFNKIDTQCQIDVLIGEAGKKVQDYTINGIDPTTVPAVDARLTQNNLGTIAPKVPVLQYHGLFDEVIPYSEEQNLHNQWCAMGVVSELNGYLGEHPTTQVLAQSDVNNWLADRMNGKKAPSSC